MSILSALLIIFLFRFLLGKCQEEKSAQEKVRAEEAKRLQLQVDKKRKEQEEQKWKKKEQQEQMEKSEGRSGKGTTEECREDAVSEDNVLI